MCSQTYTLAWACVSPLRCRAAEDQAANLYASPLRSMQVAHRQEGQSATFRTVIAEIVAGACARARVFPTTACTTVAEMMADACLLGSGPFWPGGHQRRLWPLFVCRCVGASVGASARHCLPSAMTEMSSVWVRQPAKHFCTDCGSVGQALAGCKKEPLPMPCHVLPAHAMPCLHWLWKCWAGIGWVQGGATARANGRIMAG